MNIRRGLWRTWVAASIIWAGVVTAFLWVDIISPYLNSSPLIDLNGRIEQLSTALRNAQHAKDMEAARKLEVVLKAATELKRRAEIRETEIKAVGALAALVLVVPSLILAMVLWAIAGFVPARPRLSRTKDRAS